MSFDPLLPFQFPFMQNAFLIGLIVAVPTALLSGAIADDARDALEGAFAGCYTLVERAGSTEAALADPLYWIRTVAAQIGHDIDRLRARG